MSCLKALRDAALLEPNEDRRYMLRGAADVLQDALDRLSANPTMENMLDANGAWAYAARVLRLMPPPHNPGGARERIAA